MDNQGGDWQLWPLISVFVPFSLVSIGGGPSIFAAIQHQSVDVHRWLTPRDFVDLFAISRAAPGPGSMLVTLIGWHISGWIGAIVGDTRAVPAIVAAMLRRRAGLEPLSRTSLAFCAGGGAGAGRGGAHPGGHPVDLSRRRIGPAGVDIGGVSALILGRWPRLHPVFLLVGGALVFVVAGRAAGSSIRHGTWN